MAGLRQGRETAAAPWPPGEAAGQEASGGPASAHCRAVRRGENPMPPGHGTSRPCGTPLGCLPGAAPGRCPAPEQPGNRPAAAPRPVAAVEQHRAADQPTASMDAAALRCSRPAADSNCLGGPDVLPIPATAGVPLAADASTPPWPGHASPAAGVQGTQATAARFARRPDEHRSDPPPTDRNTPRENGAHRQASAR